MKHKKANAPIPANQAEQLTDKLTRSGFKIVRTDPSATVLKKGKLSFVVKQDGSVFNVNARTGQEVQIMQAAA